MAKPRKRAKKDRLTARAELLLHPDEKKYVEDILCSDDPDDPVSFNTAIRRLINQSQRDHASQQGGTV